MTGRGRGKEVSLQTEIESQEDWEENIAKEGLLIIDVFQEWCGPCKAMLPVFKRIKNESGDELLRFAVAKADSVEALERYRGKCEPCFLFYAGGVLVEVVHGADSPGLNRAIIDQLANEHKVLEGGATRHEKVDPKFPVGGISRKTHRQSTLDGKVAEVVVSESEGSSDEEESEARRIFVEREVTLCIIKPDVVADGKIKDVLQKIRGAGIEVLEELEKHLTYEEASELYAPIADEPYTEDLMQLMSSGPCEFLILSKGEFGENIVHEFKEMLGPVGVADAKERAPKSLRALFGKQDSPSNGIYGSHTPADAKKNIPLFFPNFVSKKVSITHIQPPKEPLTIGIIRPEALDLRRDEILQTIKDRGYEILLSKEMTMTEEEVETFFAREKEDHGYHEMAECMVSGPCLVMALTNHKETIVQDWLNTIGPKEQGGAAVKAPDCLQNKFGSLTTSVEQFHGTPSEDLVDAEADFFFPMEQTVVIVKPDAYSKRDHIMQLFRNAGLFIAGRKELRMTRRQAVQTYSKCEDKEFYDELLEFMTSGMSCVMILSARKAVDRTRLLVGTIDTAPSPSQSSHPLDNLEEQQKDSTEDFEEEEQPEYEDKLAAFKFTGLRKQFGTDMLRNAIHASSSVEAAKEEISMFWGDVHFDEEGCMKKKKKVKRETICEARGKLTTKEEVYEDLSKLPKLETNIDEEAEAERLRLLALLAEEEEARIRKLEEAEARIIFEAKYIEDGDLKWGTAVEVPATVICCVKDAPLAIAPPDVHPYPELDFRDIPARMPTPDRISDTEVQLAESDTDLLERVPDQDDADACICPPCEKFVYLHAPHIYNWYREIEAKLPCNYQPKGGVPPKPDEPDIHDSEDSTAAYMFAPYTYNWFEHKDGNSNVNSATNLGLPPKPDKPDIHDSEDATMPYMFAPYTYNWFEHKDGNSNMNSATNLGFIDDATEGDEVKESQETDQQHAQDAEEGTGEPEHALEGESGETEHAHTEESGETEHAHPEESGETEHAEAGDSGEAEHAQDRDSGGAGHVHFATDEIAEEHREKHTDEQEQGGEQRNENNKTPENVTAGTHEAHHEEHHEEHHEGHHEEQHNAHHEEHHEEHHDADNKEHHEEHHEAHHEAHHDEHHDEHHDADHKEHHDAGEPAHTDKGKEATETSEPPAEQTNEQPEATQ